MNAQAIMNAVRKAEDSCRFAAYVVLKGGEHVGTVRIKYPPAGQGERRLVVHVADWELERPENIPFEKFTRWQIGAANGYGYDKAGAAISGLTIAGFTFLDNGHEWSNQLRAAGFTVLRAL